MSAYPHSYKIELVFTDRVGIVADVSVSFARHGLNIVSMEVVRQAERAHLYFEAEGELAIASLEDLFTILGDAAGLLEIRFIPTLPQEERENRFRVVLDNISDGVISIDTGGRITTINAVARKALGVGDREVIGRSVESLNLPDDSLRACLAGKSIQHARQDLVTDNGRFQYVATFNPIVDGSGQVIGAVQIAKDVKEVRLLARSLAEPDQISFSDIIGQNEAIRHAITFAERIAPTASIVSLRGDSGTGKELFARAIHTASGRRGPFIAINCAALPEHLLESELFGYVGGAFTGSKREGKAGLFEHAKGGSVFLDEIAEMPLSAQAKILRLIQEKSVRRIGGSKEIPINARIITATNRNLESRVAGGKFRQDLYYRINVLPIHIPPLAARRDDIELLVAHFLFRMASHLDQPVHALTAAALQKLMGHDWPGNVRELKNVVERAAILSDGELIGVENILFSHEMPARSIGGGPVDRSAPLKALVADYEKQLIKAALQRHSSIRQTARTLGLSHTALIKKVHRYKLRGD
ncbi:MAG: sigma 54-interacting transcriptional regulator [Desulfosarcinaceae bacterium]|nr:sigma 54-interacting transcriptional regulator [Desulfosarcinaceae bacterium]